jgi:hypothetical protein
MLLPVNRAALRRAVAWKTDERPKRPSQRCDGGIKLLLYRRIPHRIAAKPGVDAMINATQAVQKQIADPPSPIARLADNAPDPGLASGDEPRSKQAESQKLLPSTGPVYDVHLDGETMRLYTELRDPQTGRVLLRLPAAYKESENSGLVPGTSIKV